MIYDKNNPNKEQSELIQFEDDGKTLKKDYIDIPNLTVDKITIQGYKGSPLKYGKIEESKLTSLFNETIKLLETSENHDDEINYNFTFSGKKGNTFGYIYVIKMDSSKIDWEQELISGTIESKEVYQYKVNF